MSDFESRKRKKVDRATRRSAQDARGDAHRRLRVSECPDGRLHGQRAAHWTMGWTTAVFPLAELDDLPDLSELYPAWFMPTIERQLYLARHHGVGVLLDPTTFVAYMGTMAADDDGSVLTGDRVDDRGMRVHRGEPVALPDTEPPKPKPKGGARSGVPVRERLHRTR